MRRNSLAITLGVLLVLALLAAGWLYYVNTANQPTSSTTETRETTRSDSDNEATRSGADGEEATNRYTSQKGVTIIVDAPKKNTLVTSPLAITGRVPGSWSFEASFPVTLVDADGAEVAQSHVTLTGDWMTDELVPFSSNLEFPTPKTSTGFLVLEKDNSSGLPENDDSVRIPVKFTE